MGQSLPTAQLDPQADAAFLKLLAQHERQLAACVHAFLPVWQDAEEVLQETRLVLWRQFGDFRPGSDFLAWARTVARNLARNRLRQNGTARRMLADDVAEALIYEMARPIEREDRRLAALTKCTESLAEESRDLLRRCYVEGMKIKEISESVGRSLNGTYMAICRIRRNLMACIERRMAQEDRG